MGTRMSCFANENRDVVEIRKRMRQFLRDWLEMRNKEDALGYFNSGIFSSEAMYQDECSSFGAMSFYINTKDRKQAIMSALEWYIEEVNYTNKWLMPEDVEISVEYGVHALNNPRGDGFFIFSKSELEKMPISQIEETSIRLRKILKDSPFYLVFLPLKIGACFFIWEKEQETWEILHAETVCE
jgi:hypothetical protein